MTHSCVVFIFLFQVKKRERKNGANKKIIEYNRMEKKDGRFLFLPIRRSQTVGAPLGSEQAALGGAKKIGEYATYR